MPLTQGLYYNGLSPPIVLVRLFIKCHLPAMLGSGKKYVYDPKTIKMKKQLFFFLNLLALVVLFTACKKNISYEKQADPIKQSRIWFNRQFDASLAVKGNQLTGGDKYPLWQMAKQYVYNGLSIVEVPLVFKNRPIYGVKESSNNFSLPANASVSKLMIARNGAGGYRAAIVDMVADKAFYNTGGEPSQISLNNVPQSFTGYVLSRTWHGQPQVGYRLEGGRVKQRIKPRKATAPAPATDETEMKDAIAGGGIPFGILCEGCDFYLNAGDVASYPICATVAMACGQEMWDTDYTDPCSIEMGNIFGCPCENGVINYDNCGFGNGGGTTTVPPPPYMLSAADIAIFNQLDAEDAETDNIYINSDCKGTKRTGNIKFNGTIEHWLIQLDYVSRNPIYGEIEYAIPGSSATGNRGYADIVNLQSNEIFEIKPDNFLGLNNGILEVDRYVTKAKDHCPVSASSFPPQWSAGNNYDIRLLNCMNPNLYLRASLIAPGVIGYTYIPKANNPAPAPVAVPVTILDKLKHLVDKLKNNTSRFKETIAEYLRENPELVMYLKQAAIGAAVAIVVATIIEDIATAGVGIWNDWASFTLAYKIVRFAWAM